MSKLNENEVNFIINKFIEENSGIIEITENQIFETKELFNSLMNEKVNSQKTKLEQESLISDILIGYSYGEKKDFMFRQHSDNKHMNYFDIFLSEGESKKIQSALYKNGIPTDILKGIKKNIPFDITKDGIQIIQEISDNGEGSPTISKFEIYSDGKLIYKWTQDLEYEEDDYIDYDYYEKEEKIPEQPKTKSGKPRKGIYLATIINSEGEKITQEKISNGRIIYRDAKGRFTRK